MNICLAFFVFSDIVHAAVTIIIALALLALCVVPFLLRRNKLVEHKNAGMIRELQKKQDELAAINASLKETDSIIANANMGIWHIFLFDGEAPRMRANAKMKELLHLPQELTDEVETYEAWHSRIKPEALDSVNNSVAEMLAGKRSENTYLWIDPVLGEQYVRCGGVAEKIEGKGYVLRGYHYNVNEEVLRDQQREIELARALEAANAANRAKTTFLNNMSHDIRTPMNAIMGFTTIALKHDPSAEVKEFLSKIYDSSEVLLTLINDVLDISRIESGTSHINLKPINITKAIDDVLEMMQGFLVGRQLEVKVERQPMQNPYVMADAIRIREVLINIMSNAVKYTEDGGTITFKASSRPGADDKHIIDIYTISDTGIGMSEEFQKHIFEEFAQEAKGARTKYKGTGLGMAITKRYVDMMGGTISLRSEKGKGTSFVVEIPLELTDKSQIEQEVRGLDSINLEGINVLLAEDNDLNAEIAQIMLEEVGLKVTRAEDGEQAIQAFEQAPSGTYDVILMDIMMPNKNGYEATRAIRQHHSRIDGKAIPIIAMTANAFAEDVQQSFEAGMNAHIAKPLMIDEVLRTIARFVQR